MGSVATFFAEALEGIRIGESARRRFRAWERDDSEEEARHAAAAAEQQRAEAEHAALVDAQRDDAKQREHWAGVAAGHLDGFIKAMREVSVRGDRMNARVGHGYRVEPRALALTVETWLGHAGLLPKPPFGEARPLDEVIKEQDVLLVRGVEKGLNQ
jgi:hypothetical protein